MSARIEAVVEFEAKYVRPMKGPTLVVGSKVYKKRPDRRKLYKQATGVDMEVGLGVDVVMDLEDNQAAALLGEYTHVDCISVLEHSKRPWLLASTIEQVLVAGGTLFLTVPFVWRIHAYPSDYWRFTAEGVKELFPNINWIHLTYGHYFLCDGPYGATLEGQKYFMQTEVFGFGTKRRNK